MRLVAQTRDMLEMIRFSHTIFALPFALLAAVMAWTAHTADGELLRFSWLHLLGIVWCMVAARSAAMAFNRLADRHIDAENPRTAGRHIPAKKLSVTTVAVFTAVSSLLFIAGTLLFWPNWLPLVLSIPVLAILLAYSYTKRFTSLAHFWLGFSLMLAPVATWIALRGQFILASPLDLMPAISLGLAVLLWVAGFDIIYACQDCEFDRQAKLKSIPARYGIAGALRIAAGCHAIMILVLVLLPSISKWGGVSVGLGWVYWLAVAAVAILLLVEHVLVKPDDLRRVNIAFFNINAIISFGLFLFGTIDLILV